jgi:penicillin-binding protein 1C
LASLFLFLWFTTPSPLEAIRSRPASLALYDREGRLFHVRLSSESEWSLPVPLSEMGKWLPRAAVAVEDKRFYSHAGVDPAALLRAVGQNAVSLRVVSGASTITSQLIRLSISEREGRSRDIATKAREFVQALKLERVMSKDDILEAYLNNAPFGGNIRGVQAASLIYFGKPASRISPGEACLLVGMLKGPSLYRPDRRPEAAKRRKALVVRLMEQRGVLSREEAGLALAEDLPSRRTAPPSRAFHFSRLIDPVGDSPVEVSLSGAIRTTLNLEMQTTLESVLNRAVAGLPDSVTAAAGIADNRTGGLLAWVGNARFGTGLPGAWVDCGRSPRSPGSALKPFAYLEAFDRGLLTPGSLLADTPLAFSGRAPRNFDLTYRGAVSARVALSDSLNAPAVRVLRMAGAENVLRSLRNFGFSGLRESASHYGDSLILGGCEVTLFQMLSAYSALADGVYRRPALLREEEGKHPGVRLASAEAAWMIGDILNHRGPLTALARETAGGLWRVALKTGTSYGLRDAWTAAWTNDLTLVVWVGDPSGNSWSGLVGSQAAAPIALAILRAVGATARSVAGDLPDGLVLREVCSLSGRPPTAACLSTRLDWSIEGVTQSVPCDIHVLRGRKSALLWPAELARTEPARGSSPLLPSEVKKLPSLRFVSPLADATYYLAPLAKEQKIPLRVEGARKKVWWYLDGRCIGSSQANETFLYGFPDGRHSLSASDEEGRTAVTRLSVVSPGRRKSPEVEIPLL